jgi:lactoylglutathione lyase
MHLYEAHLPVSDTKIAQRFYVEIVGLRFAHRDLTRDVVFLWAGADRRSMLGLWGPSTTLGSEFHKCHIAFNVSLDELLAAGERLNAARIQTQNFAGEKTTEPSVIGWMPSAQLYFCDHDGHSLEFIALLDESPESKFVGA